VSTGAAYVIPLTVANATLIPVDADTRMVGGLAEDRIFHVDAEQRIFGVAA
jgi:hypothetical protein